MKVLERIFDLEIENEKLKKAIDILKDKKVVVGYLLICSTLENYNRPTLKEYHLTEEEYELLKEVLE